MSAGAKYGVWLGCKYERTAGIVDPVGAQVVLASPPKSWNVQMVGDAYRSPFLVLVFGFGEESCSTSSDFYRDGLSKMNKQSGLSVEPFRLETGVAQPCSFLPNPI